MTSILAHVGQCGCQLAVPLWGLLELNSSLENGDSLGSSSSSSGSLPTGTSSWWFDEKRRARAVLIDTEPRVVSDASQEFFDPSCVVHDNAGRANNFAAGYSLGFSRANDHNGSRNFGTRAHGAMRRQIERCDSFQGIISMHATAGGTGSGCGARLMEDWTDEFGCRKFISVSILPFDSGEAVTQIYNSLFSLAWSFEYSDSIVLFANDSLMEMNDVVTEKNTKPASSILTNFEDMNGRICEPLSLFLSPPSRRQGRENKSSSSVFSKTTIPSKTKTFCHTTTTPSSPFCSFFDPYEFVAELCALPSKKFLRMTSTALRASRGKSPQLPLGVQSISDMRMWEAVGQALCKQINHISLPGETPGSGINHATTQAIVVARGLPGGQGQALAQAIPKTVEAVAKSLGMTKPSTSCCNSSTRNIYYPFLSWKASPYPMHQLGSRPSSAVTAPVLASCMNTSATADKMHRLLKQAAAKVAKRSHLHWYSQYGFEAELFLNALDVLDEATNAYRTAL